MKIKTKDNIPEINLKIKTKIVQSESIPTKFKYKIGTPIFGMSNSARKYFGMSKKQLKKWSEEMLKNWKKYGNKI